MAIILVLSISYSYGEGLNMLKKGLRAHPSGEPGKYEIYDIDPGKGQSTTTPATAHEYDVTGGSSTMISETLCGNLERKWKGNISKIATILRTTRDKLQNLKKSIKLHYSKKAFIANYKKTRLPRARKQGKSNAWIRSDIRSQYKSYKHLRKKKYYSARKAIGERAKSEIMAYKQEMRAIKKEYKDCRPKK